MHDSRIESFLEELARTDGFAPLSDAKRPHLRDTTRTLIIEEGDRVVAVAVAAQHQHGDGSDHWSIETALDPGLRFSEFEDRVLLSALDLVPAGREPSVWSHRGSLDEALTRSGFIVTRELAYMSIKLPVDAAGPIRATRLLRPSDTAEIVALNNAAFSLHREAGSLGEDEFLGLLDQDGMGAEAFLVLLDEDEDEDEILGFCWTRVHENRDGEIFRIAVRPENQGRGIGRELVLAGFHHLAGEKNVSIGTLWVDTSNKIALKLYKGLGMRVTSTNREFEKLES
jgi:mycothiol synthase